MSLRYKILAALTALPLVGLTLFLLLAINIFEKDKIAYVFDSSLAVSKTKAARVRSEVSALISITQSVVLSYSANTKTLADSGTYFFQREGKFQAFHLYTINPETGGYDRSVQLVKEAAAAHFAKEEPAIPDLLKEAREKTIVSRRSKAGDLSVTLALRFGNVDDPKHVIAVASFQATEFAEPFLNAGAHTSFLAEGNGAAVFAPQINDPSGAEWGTAEIWQKIGGKKVPEGIAEILSPSQSPYLASFVSVGLGDLVVVSLVDKGSALEAVNNFIRKSLVFSIGLIAAMLIISVLTSRGLTMPLDNLADATQKVAEGDFNVRVEAKTRDEIGALAKSFNTMAEEVSRLMKETAEKARMESELATAKTVQETLFPDNRARIGPVQISGHYQPASECGGDWWHYCENGDMVYLWIGDATGHGAPAALLTSAARAVASVIEGGPPLSPAQSMAILNRAICDTSKGKMMMTFFLAAINKRTGIMSYSNASHEAPLLLRATADMPSRDDYVPLNEVNNPRLGENVNCQFKEAHVRLAPGDRIVFYTDGVVDVKNEEAKVWGERRFLKALSTALYEHLNDTDEALDKVVHSIAEFRQQTPLDDDVTLIVCGYTGAA